MVSVAEQQPIRADDNAHVRHIFLLGFAPINIKVLYLSWAQSYNTHLWMQLLFCFAMQSYSLIEIKIPASFLYNITEISSAL